MVWSNFSLTTLRINIFDLLHAPFAEYISDKEIKKWSKEFKLTAIEQKHGHDTVWSYFARVDN
jgi:hypothetical protein